MDIQISVETGRYRLISSGTLLTIDDQPVLMTVEIDEEESASVLLIFHHKKHPDGKSLVRSISIDGTVDEWHIYESADGDCSWLIQPEPIVQYQDAEEQLTLYLQIHLNKIATDGTIKLDFCWLEGDREISV